MTELSVGKNAKNSKNLCHVSIIMFLLSILLLALISCLLIESHRCTQTIDDADRCAQTVSFFGDHDVFIPLSNKDMDKHCALMSDSVHCVHQFGRTCLPSFPQQALQIFTYDLKQVIRQRCKNTENRKKFIGYAKCWSPKHRLNSVNTCYDKHIAQLEYIIGQIETDYHLAAICCTYHQRHDCVKREISRICDRNNVDYVVEIIDNSVKDMALFACGPYISSLDCEREFNSSIWLPLKNMVNQTNEAFLSSPHKYRSALPLALKIITGIEL